MPIPDEAGSAQVAFLPPMSGLADREFVKQPGEIIPAIQKAKRIVESGKPALIEVFDRVDTDLSLYN